MSGSGELLPDSGDRKRTRAAARTAVVALVVERGFANVNAHDMVASHINRWRERERGAAKR